MDIRPANLFIGHNMDLKIGDFGFAAKFDNHFQTVFDTAGNDLEYMSPEMLNKSGYTFGQVVRWAMGILIFHLLVGRTPFAAPDYIPVQNKQRTIVENVTSRMIDAKFPPKSDFSEEVRSLVGRLLNKNNYMRPTSIDEVCSEDFFMKNKIPRFLPLSCLSELPDIAINKPSCGEVIQHPQLKKHSSCIVQQSDPGEIEFM